MLNARTYLENVDENTEYSKDWGSYSDMMCRTRHR